VRRLGSDGVDDELELPVRHWQLRDEAGELQGLTDVDIVELGEILSGRKPGRTDDAQRTVFKSVGNAIQDLVVAARAYERARAQGIGEELAFP